MAFITPLLPIKHLSPPLPLSSSRPLSSNRPLSSRSPLHAHRPTKASLEASFGVCADKNATLAIETAIQTALPSLSAPPTLAILTCTSNRPVSDILQIAHRNLPNTQLHGCTTNGSVLTNAGAHPNGIGILLLRFPAKAHSHVSREIPTAQEARGVAEEAGKELKKLQADVHTVLISATPGIEEAVLQGLQLALPNVKIIGATAADETLSGEWRVLGESAMPCGLSAVAFGAGARVGTACVAPYERTDGMEEGVVTEADGRVIKMVNGKRAADVLSMWLPGVDMAWKEGGSDVTVACARQPVGLVRAGGDEWTGLHLAEVYADGSIRAFAKVESGDRVVKLQNVDGMECSDAIARGVGVAYEKALEDGNMKDAKGGVLVYCGGIGMAVGEGIDDSLRELGEKEAKVMGVTAFGEQGVCDGVFAQYNLSLGMALFG